MNYNMSFVPPDKEVVDSVQMIIESKMKPQLKFQLNKLYPFITPPASQARDNSQYIISE